MSHESRTCHTVFYALFPPSILLGVDFFALSLQNTSLAISHFAFATLVAQLLCLWIFWKGQICPGQRERLVNMNKGLLLFYIGWLLVSGFSTYRFLVTTFVSLCGIGTTLAICFQPKKATERLPFIYFGIGMGLLGMLSYLLMCLGVSMPNIPRLSLFTQTLTGIILANLLLLSARSRLHRFMALLPMAMLIVLCLNAIAVFCVLFFYLDLYPNQFAWWLYFALHLLLGVIIGAVLFFKQTFHYLLLLIAFIISCSLPLWATLSCFPL